MSAPTSPRDIVPKTPANTPTNKTVLDLSLIMVGVSPDFMAENKNDDNYCKKKKKRIVEILAANISNKDLLKFLNTLKEQLSYPLFLAHELAC